MKTQTVTSIHLNKKVELIDDCGCATGGFYEKVFIQHGFHGAKWPIGVKFYCDQCHKELKQVEQSLTSTPND